MLYNYYMKINQLRSILFVSLFLLPCLLGAQVTVVRVQDKNVYLDTSSLEHKVQKGQPFKLIVSTEKLVNPKTGKDLGNLYQYSSAGKITEVQPLYAVGTLPAGVSATVGQEAVLEEPSAVPHVAAPVASSQNTDADTPAKNKLVYAPVDQIIISISEGPILAAHTQNIVTLSEVGQVTVWTRANEALRENASYQLPALVTPLTVSAAPLSDPEVADVFVSYFDTRQNRIWTTVLHYRDNELKEIDSLPYYVKAQGCGNKKTVWAQRAFVNDAYPGNARPLVYKDNQFVRTDDSRVTRHNWISSTAWFPIEKEQADNFIYTANNGKVTIVLANGKKAESKDLFAASPNRVKYKQDLVKFYPSLQVFGSTGNAVIAAVENTSKLGLLSSTFGQYNNGKIHFLSYEKGRLKINDSVELDGVVYDIACTANTLLGAEVLSIGTSSVVEIFN